MLLSSSKSKNFRKVMYLVIALAVCTNISIVALLVFISAPEVLFSPIGGTLIFMACYYVMIKELVSVKNAFIITSYTVAAEVIVHTHFLGWDAGFFYYFYAISLVFLLDYSWRVRHVILFNGSIAGMTILTAVLYKGKQGVHLLPQSYTDNLNSFNQSIIGVIILTIAIYFSHTNNSKDKILKQANLELEAQNKEISEQRNRLQILLKEVHHRVKNNLQIISSLISLQSRTIEDTEVLSLLNKSQKRIEAIALIHQNLYGNKPGNEVDFPAYIYELINSQQLIGTKKILYNTNFQASRLDLDLAVPLGLILSEMMTNSVKHAFENVDKPQIDISFLKEEGEFSLVFKDNGIGFPEDFDQTKSESLGIEIILALVEQIDAKISFKNNNGAEITIV